MAGSAQRAYPRTEPPGFAFYLLAATVILVCLQALVYLFVLRDTVGPFSVLGREPPPDPSLTQKPRAVLFHSEPTARLWAREGDSEKREAQWLRVARASGIPIAVAADAALAGSLSGASVLILPGAVCMGPAARTAVTEFLRAGKGVVATGAIGSRSEDCEWQGWDLLQQLTGAQAATTASPGPAFAAFNGQRFFSEAVPVGYRLSLPAQELVLVQAADPDAFLSDWMLRPAGGTDIPSAGLAVHGRFGDGRVAWFGFAETLPRSRGLEQQTLDAYMTAAIRWAGKQPMAIVDTWPSAKQAAVVLAQEVEPGDAGAEETARLLAAEGVPLSSFLSSAEARRSPEAARRLRAAGEVGSGADSAEPLAGQPAEQQAARLRQAREEIEAAAGTRVVGLAPPQGLSGPNMAAALNEAGYQYYLNEMAVTRAVPEVVEFTPSVLFPLQKREVLKFLRTAPDDVEALADSPPDGDLAGPLLADFRRLQAMGGLYTLYFHSGLLGGPEHREALRRVAREIKAQPVWLTTGSQLAEWWSSRIHVEASVGKLSVHRLRLDVANKGLKDVEAVDIDVHLPYRPKTVRLRATVFRFRPPSFRLLEGELLRVEFPKLSAQTNYTYLVALDEE